MKDFQSQVCEKIVGDSPSFVMLVPSLVTLRFAVCVILVKSFLYLFLAFFQIPKLLAAPGVGWLAVEAALVLLRCMLYVWLQMLTSGRLCLNRGNSAWECVWLWQSLQSPWHMWLLFTHFQVCVRAFPVKFTMDWMKMCIRQASLWAELNLQSLQALGSTEMWLHLIYKLQRKNVSSYFWCLWFNWMCWFPFFRLPLPSSRPFSEQGCRLGQQQAQTEFFLDLFWNSHSGTIGPKSFQTVLYSKM